jgi:hypothetical protein
MQVVPSQVEFSLRRKDQDGNEFDPAGNEFPRSRVTTVDLNPTNATPVALIRGFDVKFEPSESSGEGRPLGNLEMRVDVLSTNQIMINNQPMLRVTVEIVFGLRDWSGDWDDEHGGTIYFFVIA